MKLIDLLVKELPKRGGWPDGAVECCWFRGDSNIDFYDEHGSRPYDCVAKFDLNGVAFEPGKNGIHEIKKHEYEAALAASQQPAWNGEGLPPVGMGVEWLSDEYGWLGGTVAAHDAKYPLIAIIRHNDGYTGCHRHEIRTKADRKREEMIDIIFQWADEAFDLSNEMNRGVCGVLYDAIAAGKIPGLKLDGDA